MLNTESSFAGRTRQRSVVLYCQGSVCLGGFALTSGSLALFPLVYFVLPPVDSSAGFYALRKLARFLQPFDMLAGVVNEVAPVVRTDFPL